MLTLALDTTARGGSAALARDGTVIRERVGDASRSHAEQLPSELRALLDGADIALAQVDVFAVAIGPGSFTGLRIGIATMQGLAFAQRKPLIGVSGLEALAEKVAPTGPVATWVDAWRGEVYAALYENGREVIPPVVDAPANVLTGIAGHLQQARPVITFAGDGAGTYRHLIAATLGARAELADPTAPPIAGVVATIAERAAAAGHRPPPDAIQPLYVRRPDAELARSRARGMTARP